LKFRLMMLAAVVVSGAIVGCGGAVKPVVQSTSKEIGQPMADPTQDKIEAKMKKAGQYVLDYAKAHGNTLPKVDSTKQLVELLKTQFPNDPDLQPCFVARNGKTWVIYNFDIQGKSLDSFLQKSQTVLLWDPLNFPPLGLCRVYLDGSTGWIMPKPVAAGG